MIDFTVSFSVRYPYLKIEFFEIEKDQKTMRSIKIDPQTFFKNLANTDKERKIDINSRRTVSELSHDFENTLGLMAQISRKSGKVWNVISITDGWTLESQNSAGEFISSEMDLDR